MTFRQFAYRNVVRNRRIYAAFFMASVFSVMVFFLFSMLLFHPSIEGGFLQEIAFLGMGIAEIVLYIFTLFFLFYSMRAFLQARSKEFGILLHLGMEKSQLHRLIFFETMLIGAGAIAAGTFLGFVFSKFFFMIVKEIVLLPELPLYVSWKPFVLTIGAFLSLFVIISIIAPYFIRSGQVADLIRGEAAELGAYMYSKGRAFTGFFLLLISYGLAAITTNAIVIGLIFFLPPIATVGTYFFFTDTLPMLLQQFRNKRRVYWKYTSLLSISEGAVRLKENARMFFIVTIVSTVAFMSVGILASLTSFASQYREMNPLGLVYKSMPENILEEMHVRQLVYELDQKGLDYSVVPFKVLTQQSSYTKKNVNIIDVETLNELAKSFGKTPISLEKGQAVFLPASISAFDRLKDRVVHTVLKESNVLVRIDGAYPHHLLPGNAIGLNAIVVSQQDYEVIEQRMFSENVHAFTYYAFNVPNWQQTTGIGLTINYSDYTGSTISVRAPFVFENPGSNYAIIRMTFSLLLFTGLLLAGVLFLTAGSFIYFRLYTSLERDRKQFAVLRRMGLTDREFKQIVNRQLIPQFFFPWGVALVHSSFAFLSLQVIWDALAEISIAREIMFVLVGFTLLQVIYFYLIRWRYLAHIKAYV